MIFAGQNTVEFDGANYSPTRSSSSAPTATTRTSRSTSPTTRRRQPLQDQVRRSLARHANYADYANIDRPAGAPLSGLSDNPDLNFPQQEDYAVRILKRYNAEKQKIDVIMYPRHRRAAHQRDDRGEAARHSGADHRRAQGIPRPVAAVGLLEHGQDVGGRHPDRVAAHPGLNHQKLVILYRQGMAVFGSSNWTSPSANSQQEHNYFTTKPWMFQWFVDQFERKWNNPRPTARRRPTGSCRCRRISR